MTDLQDNALRAFNNFDRKQRELYALRKHLEGVPDFRRDGDSYAEFEAEQAVEETWLEYLRALKSAIFEAAV